MVYCRLLPGSVRFQLECAPAQLECAPRELECAPRELECAPAHPSSLGSIQALWEASRLAEGFQDFLPSPTCLDLPGDGTCWDFLYRYYTNMRFYTCMQVHTHTQMVFLFHVRGHHRLSPRRFNFHRHRHWPSKLSCACPLSISKLERICMLGSNTHPRF